MPDSFERRGIAGLGELILQVHTGERRECPPERGVDAGREHGSHEGHAVLDPTLGPTRTAHVRESPLEGEHGLLTGCVGSESRARLLAAAGANNS